MIDATPAEAPYLTIGQLAERLCLPIHRIRYAVDIGRVKPAMRVGITRVWRESDVAAVRGVLDKIAGRNARERADAKLTCA